MDRNVGSFDRRLRGIGAVVLLVFGYRNRDTRLGTLAFIGGSDLLATALIQRCPGNALLGIDTCHDGQTVGEITSSKHRFLSLRAALDVGHGR